jgi:hypothetical protein
MAFHYGMAMAVAALRLFGEYAVTSKGANR